MIRRVLLSILLSLICTATSEARPRTNLTPDVVRRIVETARRYNLPPLLVLEVMRQESAFRRDATSYKNGRPCAHGLMQMVRGTAGRFGVSNPYDPQQAIEGGCRYLAWLTNRYGRHRLDLILAAYNAGEGAVDRHGRRVPPFAETQNYVRLILAEYGRATQLEAELGRRHAGVKVRAAKRRMSCCARK